MFRVTFMLVRVRQSGLDLTNKENQGLLGEKILLPEILPSVGILTAI